jgi:hypothetical protein
MFLICGFIRISKKILIKMHPMKKITYLLFLLVTTISFSQVGIGTASPSASSLLDITATDAGLLIPRMLQSERDAIQDPATGQPATGLMVYQTNNTPGFYYYDGSGWIATGSVASGTMTQALYQDLTQAVKVTNTLTGDLNTATETVFSYFTTSNLIATSSSDFSIAADGITPNFNGTVDVVFNIELDLNSSAQRSLVAFRWKHNNQEGPWVAHTYMRNGSGHAETSANFSTTIKAVNGQKIQIQHKRLNTAGSVISPAGGVAFIVKKRSED